MKRTHNCWLLLWAGLMLACPVAWAKDCRPAKPDVATLYKISDNWYSIRGDLAEFDPCHRSVSLDLPSSNKKLPLMIVVHGGIGLSRTIEMAAHNFRKLGMATLVFDAFQMNGLQYLGVDFFNRQMNNESRQRMIFKVTRGAYHWAIQQEGIDDSRIFFWGVSNGAAVVANMAAIVNPRHVKALFAEGLPPQGLGLPNVIKAPLFLAYGEDDNYGVDDVVNKRQWTRTGTCKENTNYGDLSHRNSKECNALSNKDAPLETVEQWFTRLSGSGQSVNFKIYKNAAHEFFANGPVKGTHVKNGQTLGSNTGASPRAREEFLNDVLEIVSRSN